MSDRPAGLPIGPDVPAHEASRPSRTRLEGRDVVLVPIDVAAHGPQLYALSHGPEREAQWMYLWDGPYPSLDAFLENLAVKAASEDPFFFSILERGTGDAVGVASYLRITPKDRVIEVGSILFTPRLQRTRGATEAMYLMARHAFDTLGYRRYEWKCNALNAPSRRAAVRLGFQFEGIFRQHMIVKGRSRDTAWFAMLDRDWPAIRAAYEGWLDPANFDAAGRQRTPLRMPSIAAPVVPAPIEPARSP
ncbi:MAG TPA: GNAT family protein [Vicinamibacterales bacterium]|nr:GNAT family protein [Vicinamibacterales bacterium]